MREDGEARWNDEFAVRNQDEKTDVVTAINHGEHWSLGGGGCCC